MKAILASIAALGLSVTAASADCGYRHTNTSAQVDTQTTASVEKSDLTKATDTQKVIKKEAPPAKAD